MDQPTAYPDIAEDVAPPLARVWGNRQVGKQACLLMLCPGPRDLRELSKIADSSQIRVLRYDYASVELESLVADEPAQPDLRDPLPEVEALLDYCQKQRVTAVASTDDYPGSTLASIAAYHLGLPGVLPYVNLLCQHKYLSRLAQRQAAPYAVPRFVSIDARPEVPPPPGLAYPVFVKPVKSYLSQGAQAVDTPLELDRIRGRWLSRLRFFAIFNDLLRRYTGYSVDYSFLIGEECLSGRQVTLDGYAYGGRIFISGVVDSIMFPGTLAFQRFEYPSSLPEEVQERMAAAASAVMTHLGYGNGQFNIEFMYDSAADRLGIIEINPRMSSQFADLYEKVDGTNGYQIMLDLAMGVRPRPMKKTGRYAHAASCVMRTFCNQKVLRVPAPDEITRVIESYPQTRVEIMAEPGKKLSQQLQDGRSYRYGLVNIGGGSREEILAVFEDCMKRLTFVFEPVPGNRQETAGQLRNV